MLWIISDRLNNWNGKGLHDVRISSIVLNLYNTHGGPDRPLVPALVTCGKYRPDHILHFLGFHFDGAARIFTVPGIS